MAEFGIQRRRAIAYQDLPREVINAFIAAEDQRFFGHVGIDLTGLARAALHLLRTGNATQGGSTITMQVARNFFLTRERTMQRKLAELLLALQIETTLTKEQILELYLNKIFFGHRAYGISAAAEFYYRKTLPQLTIAEIAMLAGLPKAPSANNPLTNPKRAKTRRDYILARMYELGLITQARYQEALTEPVAVTPYTPEIEFHADDVAEMVRQEMVNLYGETGAYQMGLRVYTTIDESLQTAADEALHTGLMAYTHRHGYHGPEAQLKYAPLLTETELDEYLETRPFINDLPVGVVIKVTARAAEVYCGAGIKRTLTLAQVNWARRYRSPNGRGPAPRRVNDAVAVGDVIRLRQIKNDQWQLAQVPLVSGALVALAPNDGAIKALAGGYAFAWSKFNRAVDSRRQPGSSFKPFVYAAAFAKGWTPASTVYDQPFSQRTGNGWWQPQNADGRFLGAMRIRSALVHSRNLAVIDLLNRIGVAYTRGYIQRFGFTANSMPGNLTLALGAGATSPLDMAAGFAVFANGGYRVVPYFISRIEDVNGNLLFDANPARACRTCWVESATPAPPDQTAVIHATGVANAPLAEQVIDARVAYNIDSILKEVITHGTGNRARVLKRPDIAGKTGTTNDSRDSWFVGYHPDLSVAVWMGMDDNRPLGSGEWGGTAALGIWVDFMREILPNLPKITLKVPPRMVTVRSGDTLEYVSEEHRQNVPADAPEPPPAAPAPRPKPAAPAPKPAPPPRQVTPRLMDELF
ncbi:penicillin-binding protein 1A [Thiospirillum jenense]|uniref:penicillin-binding protein 1A n=1 Tax=Thiospirillum jenense TaxID=1653858 RepID=UPI003B838006